jgi:nucleotide-binding universal stress UspA family protein
MPLAGGEESRGVMPYQRLLVPINGSVGDEHALRVAITNSRRYRGLILVVYVVEVQQALPLDAELPAEVERGEAAVRRCEVICRDERVEMEGELLQARSASAAIVDEAAQRDIDLIIMSVEGRQRRGEFSLGRTAPYVLKHATCEVWLLRRPAAGT